MLLLPRARRWFLWIAVLAIGVGSLALSFARMAHSQTHPGWIEVCTATGMKWLQIDPAAGEAPDEAPSRAAVDGHCGWCTAHSPLLGLPPEASTASVVLARDECVVATAFASARLGRPDSAPPPSRAPPVPL